MIVVTLWSTTKLIRSICLAFIIIVVSQTNAIPTELDPFLELLFETPECEDFIGDAEYLSVATTECKPFECDFPRQLCMRPAMKLTDESTNQCRSLPEKCLTAANGGISLGPAKNNTILTSITIPSSSKPVEELLPNIVTAVPETNLPAKPATADDICEMDQPQGRFCGFQVKYAYNRENRRCEQFWFPGCKTEETNVNLFDTEDDCLKTTFKCHDGGSVTEVFSFTSTTTPLVTTPQTQGRPFFSVKPPTETPATFMPSFNLRNLISGGQKPPLPGGLGVNGKQSYGTPKGSLLGLITDGLSQFTNSGGIAPESESSSNFLESFNLDKIPQLIKTLQEARSGTHPGYGSPNPVAGSSSWTPVQVGSLVSSGPYSGPSSYLPYNQYSSAVYPQPSYSGPHPYLYSYSSA